MKSVGKDHRIYCEKAYKIERQDIFHTLDETKNHSHKLTVTFRTCLNILEQHFKTFKFNPSTERNTLAHPIMMKISFESTFAVLLESFVFNLNVRVNTIEG